ncbi:MAG: hypothetical protein HY517_01665 [Candidatus Aenigmarchaeota archaeon]|nr:hypothetical protein [Candidatus Aenigmarchaeota archaeon]
MKSKRYRKVLNLFRKRGFEVIEVRIKWKNNTMTDYVNQFLHNYKPKKESYLFGFSFGAVIALLSAKKAMPECLILCSLSPYFREDLPMTRKIWGKTIDKYFKKKDLDDLKKYSFQKVAKGVRCKTILLAGDMECVIRGKNNPIVEDRARDAKRRIKNSHLIIVKNGKHDISQKEYNAALRKVINRL